MRTKYAKVSVKWFEMHCDWLDMDIFVIGAEEGPMCRADGRRAWYNLTEASKS